MTVALWICSYGVRNSTGVAAGQRTLLAVSARGEVVVGWSADAAAPSGWHRRRVGAFETSEGPGRYRPALVTLRSFEVAPGTRVAHLRGVTLPYYVVLAMVVAFALACRWVGMKIRNRYRRRRRREGMCPRCGYDLRAAYPECGMTVRAFEDEFLPLLTGRP